MSSESLEIEEEKNELYEKRKEISIEKDN